MKKLLIEEASNWSCSWRFWDRISVGGRSLGEGTGSCAGGPELDRLLCRLARWLGLELAERDDDLGHYRFVRVSDKS